MQAKMETAADKYRRTRQEKEVLHPVTCEHCGSEWQCHKRGLQFWIESGIMPTDLAAAVATLQKSGKVSESDIVETIAPEIMLKGIEFTSKVVRMTAAEPRIVECPREGENELGYDEVMQCCYDTLRNWQLPGGGKAANLTSFPGE